MLSIDEYQALLETQPGEAPWPTRTTLLQGAQCGPTGVTPRWYRRLLLATLLEPLPISHARALALLAQVRQELEAHDA